MYVATDGGIYVSWDDGVSWQAVATSPVSNRLLAVAWDPGRTRFVAVTQAGAVIVSNGVQNWSILNNGVGAGLNWVAVGL